MRKGAVILAVVLVAPLVSPLSSARAEEMKWRSVSYISKFDVKPVGDVDGHVSGSFVRRGLAFFDRGEVAILVNIGTLDHTKGVGSYKGEGTFTFEDGSTLTADFQGTLEPVGSGRTAHKGGGAFLRGTGRFEGIGGSYTYTGKSMTPYGQDTRSETYYDSAATFALPKR